MATVSINPPRTPVTRGSNGIAAATLPNVCKMPGPPAPFVPTPLPNVGKSGQSPRRYSSSVVVEGDTVAIEGATFGSVGDVAAKGTGGGLLSQTVEGWTAFVGPGSFDVHVEGKRVQLLGDQMLNNCGPSGTPANAATMAGVLQLPEVVFTERPSTCCVRRGTHRWEAHEATGQPRLQQKILEAEQKVGSKGAQFEAAAAKHNMGTGELRRSSQMSGSGDAIVWVCAICGLWREGDQLHDGPPGAPPVAVEVKGKPLLRDRDLAQLGRNIKAVQQGGASGLIYKIPASSRYDFSAGQVRAAGEAMSVPIRIVRI